MLFPKLFISSSASVILYLWLKSKFAIFCAILFNSNIGSVNFLEITETIIADIKIVNPAIIIKKLFDMRTLSFIDDTGILMYK